MKTPQYQITLEAARITAGLTEAQVAKALRMKVETLRKYEANSGQIPGIRAVQFALLYNMSIDLLWVGKAGECAANNAAFMHEYRSRRNIG